MVYKRRLYEYIDRTTVTVRALPVVREIGISIDVARSLPDHTDGLRGAFPPTWRSSLAMSAPSKRSAGSHTSLPSKRHRGLHTFWKPSLALPDAGMVHMRSTSEAS